MTSRNESAPVATEAQGQLHPDAMQFTRTAPLVQRRWKYGWVHISEALADAFNEIRKAATQ